MPDTDQKNLFMAWIDYKKAYDSVSHSSAWTGTRCILRFALIQNVMKYWKVSLYCADQCYGEVTIIMRGIYQGDSLSSLLFVLALMPLPGVLNNTGKCFILEKNGQKVNHLLYLDNLKLFARTKTELESLLKTVQI